MGADASSSSRSGTRACVRAAVNTPIAKPGRSQACGRTKSKSVAARHASVFPCEQSIAAPTGYDRNRRNGTDANAMTPRSPRQPPRCHAAKAPARAAGKSVGSKRSGPDSWWNTPRDTSTTAIPTRMPWTSQNAPMPARAANQASEPRTSTRRTLASRASLRLACRYVLGHEAIESMQTRERRPISSSLPLGTASIRSAGLTSQPSSKRAACPPHSKTIDRVDHCSSMRNIGISREFRSEFANRGSRDSSDHCSTD